MSGDVRVPVQHNVNVIRRAVRRYMLQPEFQSVSDQINNQRPFEITVAIPSNNGDSGPKRAELVQDRFGADVPQVPNFIRAFSHFTHPLRQTIMRIREHENAPRVFL